MFWPSVQLTIVLFEPDMDLFEIIVPSENKKKRSKNEHNTKRFLVENARPD